MIIPQNSNAASCAITDCASLGYTDSSCSGEGLKCPFGEAWFCGGTAAEDCIKLGYDKTCTGAGESGAGETCNGKYQSCICDSAYKYACSGTGYAGGAGTACGGKYTKCNCTSPYTWTSGACKCPTKYQYTCSGTGYAGGAGTACGGKYTKCKCATGYTWYGKACEVTCNNTVKAASCTNNCLETIGTPCYKNGEAYYSGCGNSKCYSGTYGSLSTSKCRSGRCNVHYWASSCCMSGDCPTASTSCSEFEQMCRNEKSQLGFSILEIASMKDSSVKTASQYDYVCYFW